MRSISALIALVLMSSFLAADPAFAEKLVVFKNGKALRAKSVVEDGRWLKCEFEDGNFMSVPAGSVLRVAEADLAPGAGASRANQVAAGSGGGFVPPRAAFQPNDGSGEANLEDQQAAGRAPGLENALAEEQAEMQQQGIRPGLNRAPPTPQNPLLPGSLTPLTPLNQVRTPFQDRNNSRTLTPQRGPVRNPVAGQAAQGEPVQQQDN